MSSGQSIPWWRRIVPDAHPCQASGDDDAVGLAALPAQKNVGAATRPAGSSRSAAMQSIVRGLHAEVRYRRCQLRQGLKLHMDHGTRYTADDLLKQIEFRGIETGFAFVPNHRTAG